MKIPRHYFEWQDGEKPHHLRDADLIRARLRMIEREIVMMDTIWERQLLYASFDSREHMATRGQMVGARNALQWALQTQEFVPYLAHHYGAMRDEGELTITV